MTTDEYLFEGGPLDGQRGHTNGSRIWQVPRPLPRGAGSGLTYSVWEYERFGKVYRFETLIGNARATMGITAEAFREADVRRYARTELRRQLEALEPRKEVDRIVWCVSLDRLEGRFTLVAIVGPRRVEHAAHVRAQLRSGLPA